MGMKFFMLFFVFVGLVSAQQADPMANIRSLVSRGEFTKADLAMDIMLSRTDLSPVEAYDLRFQKDRLRRIRLDFNKTADDVIKYLKPYYPKANEKLLKEFEKDGTLECMLIDGHTKYFSRAASNLFLLSKKAMAQKERTVGKTPDHMKDFLSVLIPNIIDSAKSSGKSLLNPVKMRLKYTVTLKANAVPDGEIIRCWLPYPKESHQRQGDLRFFGANVPNYILAPDSSTHRSIYMEKRTEKDKPTVFSIEMGYTTLAEKHFLDESLVKPYDVSSLLYRQYTSEVAPHIVFTDNLRSLSRKIIGDAEAPLDKLRKIYSWISLNIPWAGAREYSTIECLPEYCATKGHGDCGIQSLLFITLCRMNGIPAKWQSGWMLHPGEVNLHDWAEAYIEGLGWVPVDQSFGLQDSKDDAVRYYYLGGMDQYRMIVNDGISGQFFPAKTYPRSETVDFQRGELEWRCGNIYFNDWDYHMDVQYEK